MTLVFWMSYGLSQISIWIINIILIKTRLLGVIVVKAIGHSNYKDKYNSTLLLLIPFRSYLYVECFFSVHFIKIDVYNFNACRNASSLRKLCMMFVMKQCNIVHLVLLTECWNWHLSFIWHVVNAHESDFID